MFNSQGEPKSSFNYFPFLAYAPSGVAEGELVYCNQGSESDLQELDKRGISVKGRIVLLRGYSASVSIYGCYELSAISIFGKYWFI